MPSRLGTARWEEQPVVSKLYPFAHGKFWLGRSENETAIGYRDDRHVCLVSGNRGGKGTSVIINNLCVWPGSAVVVDPKGENATVTASRRGRGDRHCQGMGQAVHVLDPFNASQVDDCYRSHFNPLDALDPRREETIDEASRLANAIAVVKDETADPFWDESARSLLRGLILHVLTAPEFSQDERNLITIRNLVLRGEWRIRTAMQDRGNESIPPPHHLLWRAMEDNPAFNGIVSGIGTRFLSMMTASSKTFEGVMQAVANHTEFLDSPGMRTVLSKSDFRLSELKTRPEGMTLFLSLPQRYMDTHYRWLRMMVALTTTEMEITRGQPASGHPVLMVLDEFAGLKRMTAIENAVAQIAGFGVKLFFVLQSLEQLKDTYKDSWETFLANAGVKVFFSIEDQFTREYVSKLAGETEIIREVKSANESESANESYAEGRNRGETFSQSTTQGTSESDTEGASYSRTHGTSQSVSQSKTKSESFGTNTSIGWSRGSSSGTSFSYGPGGSTTTYSYGGSSSSSGSSGTSHNTTNSVTEGTSSSESNSETLGTSASHTAGTSHSDTEGISKSTGSSQTHTEGYSRTAGTVQTETVHRRPLIQPDEVGRLFRRVDDRNDPAYPGLALVLIAGANPMGVRRTHYFEDVQFIDCFSPHPDHEFVPALPHTISGIRELLDCLDMCWDMGPQLMMGKREPVISEWLIKPGDVLTRGQVAASIDGVPPDNRTVHLIVPWQGKLANTAATNQNMLPSGAYRIPDESLFTAKNYGKQGDPLDPFRELRRACYDALEIVKPVPVRVSRPQRRAVQDQVRPRSTQFKSWPTRWTFREVAILLVVCVLLGSLLLIWFLK